LVIVLGEFFFKDINKVLIEIDKIVNELNKDKKDFKLFSANIQTDKFDNKEEYFKENLK
jgi:hypothetical protein